MGWKEIGAVMSETQQLLAGERDGVVFFKPIGRADVRVAPQLEELAKKAIETNVSDIIVDLSETRAIDSTFVGVLCGLWRRLAELRSQGKEAQIRLFGMGKETRESLESLNLLQLFPLAEELPPVAYKALLPWQPGSPEKLREVVAEAHRRLIEAAPDQEPKFRDLLGLLEEEGKRAQDSGKPKRFSS